MNKTMKLIKGLEHGKLYLWQEHKLRIKLIMLNCAFSALGVSAQEAKDDLQLNRILDLENRIIKLQNKIKEFIILNEMV